MKLGRGDAKFMYWLLLWTKMEAKISLLSLKNEHQWNVNNFRPCIIIHLSAMWTLLSIYELLIVVLDKNTHDHIVSVLGTE